MKSLRPVLGIFLKILLLVSASIAICYHFILQPLQVQGSSLAPNILSGEYLLQEKITYLFSPPQRSDIIIYKDLINGDNNISRVIGLPSETITIRGGKVYINSQLLLENYLPTSMTTSTRTEGVDTIVLKLGPDQYFVMGDNRAHSNDSRQTGPVSVKDIRGRVFYRLNPKFEKFDKYNLSSNASPQQVADPSTKNCRFYNSNVIAKSNGLGVFECKILTATRIDVKKSYCETGQSKKKAFFQGFLQGNEFGYTATLDNIDKNESVVILLIDLDGNSLPCSRI